MPPFVTDGALPTTALMATCGYFPDVEDLLNRDAVPESWKACIAPVWHHPL